MPEISGTPVSLVVLSMDFCGRIFGVSPCLATGEKCYNTYPTCKYKIAYLRQGKDYKFTSIDAPAPFDGVRPYVTSVRLLATEIKAAYTVAGRVTVEFADEPDGDVGIDPYLTSRAAFPNIPGTFWRKFLARNANYKGRRIRVYEGWLGEAEAVYDLRWVGKLDTIRIERSAVRIEALDLLKDLSRIEVPAKSSVKLRGNIDEVTTSLIVTINADLETPAGTVRIGDEIVTYTGADLPTGALTGCARGAHGTTAASHSDGDKVQRCRVFTKQNPVDLAKSLLLVDGGMDAGDVDTVAFDAMKIWPAVDLDVGPVVVSEPTKLSILYYEVLDLLNAKSWQSESNKITVMRDVASVSLDTQSVLSDIATVQHKTAKVDHNEKSRLTRVWLYWDLPVIEKSTEESAYRRADVAILATAETSDSFGEVLEKKILSRWLVAEGQVKETVEAFARNVCGRHLVRHADASPVVAFKADLKDEALRTGDFVSFDTDEITDVYGNNSGGTWQVVKREKRGDSLALSLLRSSIRRIGRAAPSGYTYTYTTAPAADRDRYLFIAGNDDLMNNYDRGYYAY